MKDEEPRKASSWGPPSQAQVPEEEEEGGLGGAPEEEQRRLQRRLCREAEGLLRRRAALGAQRDFLEREAEELRAQSRAFVGFVAKTAERRREAVVSAAEANRQRLKRLRREQREAEGRAREAEAGLREALLRREAALSRLGAQMEALSGTRALREEQERRLRELRRELDAAQQQHRRQAIERLRWGRWASRERTPAPEGEEEAEAARWPEDGGRSLRRENRELRRELERLVRRARELEARKALLEERVGRLRREEGFLRDLVRRRRRVSPGGPWSPASAEGEPPLVSWPEHPEGQKGAQEGSGGPLSGPAPVPVRRLCTRRGFERNGWHCFQQSPPSPP